MENPGTTGSQKETAPGFGEKSGMGDLLSVGLRYGIPLAYLGATQRQIKKLRKDAKPDLMTPDLMTGAVRDLPRPNTALPYSPEMGGSSLAEYMNNAFSRDAFQRDRELDFEMKNAMNRQAQEDQILNRTNQKSAMEAQIFNQEELFNAQLAAQELLGYALPDRTSTIESLFQNVDRDIYNAGVIKDTKEIAQAQEVVRHPDMYGEQQYNWAKSILSSTGMPMMSAPASTPATAGTEQKRAGGKLRKTKFSMNC